MICSSFLNKSFHMSDISNNTLLDIDHIALVLQEGLVELFNVPVSLSKCREIVVRTFDDLIPNRLEWSNTIADTRTETTKSYLTSLGIVMPSDDILQSLGYLLHEIDQMVLKDLTMIVPFPTWSYIFVQGIGDRKST